MDRHPEPMALPVLRIGEHHPAGDDRGDAEPTGRGAHQVALLARAQLGVDIPRATAADEVLEQSDVLRQDEQPLVVLGES